VIAFPVGELRREFPALERAGDFLFFDNAAGAQVPANVLAAVIDHLVARNVQRGGPYGRSQEVDAMIARAREAVAVLVNARSASEIAFGLNATSFIRSISLAVGQTLGSRPEIVISDLDHEANVATWIALERAGARIVWWKVRDDGRLHVEDLEALLSERTRLVACTVASNATGTRVDVAAAAQRAHAVGAEIFLDAVHFGPHGAIDVQALDCDYLVCSGYKIFSPHMGFAWCRAEAINRLPTFREDFIPDVTPDKLEAGTYAYENVAGMEAVINYLERLGQRTGQLPGAPRRTVIRAAMDAIAEYERTLSAALLDAVLTVDGAIVHGVTDRLELADRVPTVSFSVSGVQSSAIAAALAAKGVGARSGHMYAPRLMHRFNLMPDGVVRLSLVHYNTLTEIARFRDILDEAMASLAPSRRRAVLKSEI
jgi:cysteine desulfurase family protein (TIGR01976 family)